MDSTSSTGPRRWGTESTEQDGYGMGYPGPPCHQLYQHSRWLRTSQQDCRTVEVEVEATTVGALDVNRNTGNAITLQSFA